jgi:hypothetical protein
MPLRDHFHPPLGTRRHWHAFHNSWATYLSSDLNRRLPQEYFAEANVQFNIEIDEATFEESPQTSHGPQYSSEPGSQQGQGPCEWTPPEPVLTFPFPLITDIVEVAVYNGEGGPVLAGAIELVSPAHKDRSAHRDAFVSKCATYLQQGVGLVIVDVVTERTANLHDELLARLAESKRATPSGSELCAAAYRPLERDGQPQLDIWPARLVVGQPLPTLPLWLRGALCLPVELEASYERTCTVSRSESEQSRADSSRSVHAGRHGQCPVLMPQ